MIIKHVDIKELNLTYFIGINQISIDLAKLLDKTKSKNQDHLLNVIFEIIDQIQNKYDVSAVQFFSQEYVLDQEHILNAIYFMEKAFLNNLNISNKKNIELLLYLATNRQIKVSLEAFGINDEDLKKGELLYCIISYKNNINEINEEIIHLLQATEVEMNLNSRSIEKFHKIKTFFEIRDNQIMTVLKSYGISNITNDLMNVKIEDLYVALNDLICEKITLLSLEKFKLD